MADEELIRQLFKLLGSGPNPWNKWRKEHHEVKVDFNGAKFEGFLARNLNGLDFSGADISNAQFLHANLTHTNLSGSKGWDVYFREAELNNANLSNAQFIRANFFHAELQEANFNGANLSGANFRESTAIEADLSGTNLTIADFTGARLNGANLSRANIGGADFTGAYLSNSDFTRAQLFGTNITRAYLLHANFTNAIIGWTLFCEIDLRTVLGLETIEHRAPSSLGVDTILLSQGKLPPTFLHGCGLPETFITQIPALVSALEPIQFYSCFISYSSQDQEFADRLYADLQNKGVRCWLATKDLKIGDKFRFAIDESIRVHDKLLLVLSEHSVSSQWVEKEVETAMEREREQNRTVLFPVRLDDAVMEIKLGWPADVRRTRHIGDFTRWKEHDSYQKVFDRLLRDLKA
jgi:uncharacterized protein YjbI with pentapeptide repeats